MPTRLSTVQRATLLRAGKSVKGMTSPVHLYTGIALEELGLGHWRPMGSGNTFYLNGKGLQVVMAIEQGASWTQVEKEYLK